MNRLNMAKWRDVEIAGNTVARFLGYNIIVLNQCYTENKAGRDD